MTSDDCRAKALECYRIAHKTLDSDARHMILECVVHWHELAAKIDRLKADFARDVASGRIAANIAKLPELLGKN
jgi:hypothetical protein